MKNWVTVKEFAKKTGLSEAAVRVRARNGNVKGCSKVGTTIIIPVAELEFMSNHLSISDYARLNFFSDEAVLYHIRVGNLKSERRGSLHYIHKDAKVDSMWNRKGAGND